MKKLLSLILATTLVFCIIPNLQVRAETELSPSQAIIDMLSSDGDDVENPTLHYDDETFYCLYYNDENFFAIYWVADEIIDLTELARDGYKLDTWNSVKYDAYLKYTKARNFIDSIGYENSSVLFMLGHYVGDEKSEDNVGSIYSISDSKSRTSLSVREYITNDTEPIYEPVENSDNNDDESVVYVWVSDYGTKYHSKESCSGMKTHSEVTLKKAKSMGLAPCSKCHAPD